MSVREKEISEVKEIMPTGPKGLVYFYCVTKTKPNRVNFENMGAKVYSVYSEGIYAIVRKVSFDEFSEERLKEKLSDMNWIEQKVLEHENMIEEIMHHTAVIPFKFPTIFHTEENVRNLLRRQGIEFKKMITHLEGKEEWGLKIYCDLERVRAAIERENETIKQKEQQIKSAHIGKAYFLKKQKEEFIKDIVNEKISQLTQEAFGRLKNLSLNAKINKLLPEEVTGKMEKMVLNAVYLINKRRIKECYPILEYLKRRYANQGFIFDFKGPWPPYNFVLGINEGFKNE